jgi:hypothetical protein
VLKSQPSLEGHLISISTALPNKQEVPELSKESENDRMSAETDFNSKEVEILSPENDLGEQTFSGNAQNIHLDVSKLYQEKLVTAKVENDTSFSLFWVRQRNKPSAPGLC